MTVPDLTTLPTPRIIVDLTHVRNNIARMAALPGDRVRILPNDSCVVTNLMDEGLLVDGDRAVGTLPIAARWRIW